MPSTKNWKRPATVALTTYWLSLFIAMHVPVQGTPWPLPIDKVIHFFAYTLLTVLVIWRSSFSWRLDRYTLTGLTLLLSLYAAVDELSQIPVGRSAEFGDWLADCAGIGYGIWLSMLIRRRRPSSNRLTNSTVEAIITVKNSTNLDRSR